MTAEATDPVAIARALIRCRSVTPADDGALARLADYLGPLGFACHRLPFSAPATPDIANLYARFGSSGRHFCFAGHSDVVPAGDPSDWRVDPFGAVVEHGVLVGRGAADMKGAIAAFVAAAARFLDRRGADFGGSISLLITGDEEGPAINGTRKMLDWLAARGETIDACLVGEPTSTARVGDTIKVGRRGSLNATLTVEGIAGHAAYPHLADNPIHRLVAMLADLTATPLDAATEHFEASTLQVTSIDVGNPASNVTPAKARAAFNSRFNDRWTGALLEAHLRGRLEKFGGRWTLETQLTGESFLTPPGDLADLLADCVATVTGRRPLYSTTGGTSDARFICRVAPVAELGLVGATMHQRNEAVPVADIETLAQIYGTVLDRYFA